MTDINKFYEKEPQTEFDKLLIQGRNVIHKALSKFIESKKYNKLTDIEKITLIREIPMSLLASSIRYMCLAFNEESQVNSLINESTEIFNLYMQDIKETFKDSVTSSTESQH